MEEFIRKLSGKDNKKLFPDSLEFRVFRHGGDVIKHSHEFLELVYIENGTGVHEINRKKYNIELGDVFVINPDEVHSYYNSVNLKIINILIKSSFLKKEFSFKKPMDGFWDLFFIEPFFREEVKFSHKLKLSIEQIKDIEKILLEIMSELQRKSHGYKILTKAKLLEFIIKLCRFYMTYQEKEKFNIDMMHKKDTLFNVLKFISENYLEKINLKDLAEIMHLQPNYFCRIFKEKTGKTPIEYVTEYRINKACDYLVHSDMNITSIAFEVGFNDSSYFTENFHRIKRLTPLQFRKKLKKS